MSGFSERLVSCIAEVMDWFLLPFMLLRRMSVAAALEDYCLSISLVCKKRICPYCINSQALNTAHMQEWLLSQPHRSSMASPFGDP
jgi:hypothetical protein